MLPSATRRLTASERAELEAERARLVVERASAAEEMRQLEVDATWALLKFAGISALGAACTVYAGHHGAAAIFGAVTVVLLGFAVRFLCITSTPLLDDPAIERLDGALARDEVRVSDVRADAAVTVRGADGEIVGDLLRTAADQVVYLLRAPVSTVDRERLPNTHLRITCVQGIEACRVEVLGEPVAPLAVVDALAEDEIWCCEGMAIVWTPSEDRREEFHFCDGETYLAPIAESIRQLAAALVTRPSCCPQAPPSE